MRCLWWLSSSLLLFFSFQKISFAACCCGSGMSRDDVQTADYATKLEASDTGLTEDQQKYNLSILLSLEKRLTSKLQKWNSQGSDEARGDFLFENQDSLKSDFRCFYNNVMPLLAHKKCLNGHSSLRDPDLGVERRRILRKHGKCDCSRSISCLDSKEEPWSVIFWKKVFEDCSCTLSSLESNNGYTTVCILANTFLTLSPLAVVSVIAFGGFLVEGAAWAVTSPGRIVVEFPQHEEAHFATSDLSSLLNVCLDEVKAVKALYPQLVPQHSQEVSAKSSSEGKEE